MFTGVAIEGLRELKGRTKVLVRIRRAALGNFGDVASVGDGIYEMRIDFGPGYRIYYAREDCVVYLHLTGGDKSTQQAEIKNCKGNLAANP